MYLKYFNLKAKPFEISPDPRFLWLGEKHTKGLASLKYGILRSKGFMALIGDVGTGKTTLLNALARSFDDNFIFARIPDPSLEELDFFNYAASAFELGKRLRGKGEFLRKLNIFLNNAHAEKKEVILVVDEAQQITPELLEDIRLISNIEKPEKKLINIIFSGQTDFEEILDHNMALRSRLAIYYKIEPLTETETDAYITHRLRVAGSNSRIFSSSAIHEIYSLSNGTPRQINIICDLALLHAYTADAMKIDPQIIRECAKRTIIPAPKPEPVVEYLKAQTIVPISQSQDLPPRELSRSWGAALTKIKSAFSLRRAAYLAPIPLIILISLIGIVIYPDNFFSSISTIQSKLKQVVSRHSEPSADANSYQAQVVNVISPAQSDSMPEISAKELENEKSRNDQLTRELAAQSALIADLQQKLEKARAEEAKLQKHLHINRQATALLKTQVKEIHSQKASTEARLEELQTANEALVNKIDQLKGFQTEVAELRNLLTERDQLLEQKENQREDLEKELAGTIDVNKQLNTELSGQTALVEELQKNLGIAKEAQSVLEGQLQESRDETESLRTQLKENNLRTVSAENDLANLRVAHNALVNEIEQLKRFQTEVAELKNLLTEKDRLLVQKEQQRDELEKMLARTQDNHKQLNTELSAQTALVADLQESLGTAEEAQTSLEGQLQKSREETESLQMQLKELKARNASADNQIASLQTERVEPGADSEKLKIAQAEVLKLQNLLDAKDRMLSERDQQLQDTKSVLDKTKGSNVDLQGELSTQAAKLADLQNKLEEMKKTEVQVAELKHALTVKDQIIAQKERQQEQVEINLVQEQNTKDKLISELSTQSALVDDLQKNLSTARDAQSALEGQLLKSHQETTLLQAQLKELNSQNAASADQLANLQTAHNALVIEVQELRNAQTKVTELKHTLTSKDRLLSQTEQRQQDLENDIIHAHKQVENLKIELASKAALVADLQKELETAKADQAAGVVQLQQNRQKMARLQEQLNELNAQKSLSAASPPDDRLQESFPASLDNREPKPEAPNPADIIDWVIKKKSE